MTPIVVGKSINTILQNNNGYKNKFKPLTLYLHVSLRKFEIETFTCVDQGTS